MNRHWCDICDCFTSHPTSGHVDLVDELEAEAGEVGRYNTPELVEVSGRSAARQAELPPSSWRYCAGCDGHKTANWFSKPGNLCDSCCEVHDRIKRKQLEAPSNMDPHTYAVYQRCLGYRMTVDEFKELERAQNYQCAICEKRPRIDRPLHIDHDHKTGRVRGLLCVACNTGLGKFGDNLRRLERAVAYLDEPPAERAGIEGMGPRKASPCL